MQQIIITKKGLNLRSKAVVNESTITFTKLCASEQDLSNVNVEDVEVLENIKQETSVSKVTVMNGGQVEVIGAFSNEEVAQGYYVKALGIYAKGDDDVEILYGVSIETEMPDYIPAFLGKTVSGISYRLYIEVEKSENVTIEVNPSTVPTMIQVQDLEERVIYIEENMITPEEKTAIQHLTNEGISTNDVVDIEFDKYGKPTMPVVTTQNILKNFDVFDVVTVNNTTLESDLKTFTNNNKSFSEDYITYNNNTNEVFDIKQNGEIVLKSDVLNMNINLYENITFSNKQGNKYLTYILQKFNNNTGVFENFIVGEEVLKLSNNDNNLTIEVNKKLVNEPLSAGTYKLLRRYRSDKAFSVYTLNNGNITLYSDETIDNVKFKEQHIPLDNIKSDIQTLNTEIVNLENSKLGKSEISVNSEKLNGVTSSGTFIPNTYIPRVNGNGGTLEIGKYIDFHQANSTKDYDGRFTLQNDGLPHWTSNATNGYFALRDDSIQSNLNADKLDGEHGSYYASKSSVDNIISGNTIVGNADKLDGFQSEINYISGGYIPVVRTDGVTQIGKYLDFHQVGSTNSYDGRVTIQNNNIPHWTSNTTNGYFAIRDDSIQSNLNADKLDGKHGSYYASKSSVDNIVNGNTIVGNADKLDGIDSTQFGRTDVRSTFTKGIDVGNGVGAGLYLEGGKHCINNNDGGGNFNIRVGHTYPDGVTENGYASHIVFDQSLGTWNFNTSSTAQTIGDAPNFQTLLSIQPNDIRYKTATMWHAGNDGSGSGLDADLLDGQHASEFAPSGYGLGSTAQIVNNTDWNDHVVTGWYMGSGMTNRPPYTSAHTWDYCTVVQHNANYCIQTVTDFNNAETWCRILSNGIWFEWKRVDIDLRLQMDNTTIKIGDNAMNEIVTYVDNVIIGNDAGDTNSEIKRTVFIGAEAQSDDFYRGLKSYDCTAIGYRANTNGTAGNGINRTVIGANASTSSDNTVQLGDRDVTSCYWGNGTNSSFSVTSDSKLKTDIEPVDLDICYNNIINLPITKYAYKDEYLPETVDKHKIGYLAEDIEKILPKSVKRDKVKLYNLDENGKPKKKKVDKEKKIKVENEDGEVVEETIIEVIEVDDTYISEEDYASINTSELLPMVIATIQKLANRVNELEEEIKIIKGV